MNIWSSNWTPWYLPTWVENIYLYKKSADGYSTFIYICQNLDVTKIYSSRWMDKWAVINPEKLLLMLGWIKLSFPSGFVVKNSPAVQEIQESHVWSLDREDPFKEEMATHSSNLVQKIPWREESIGL